MGLWGPGRDTSSASSHSEELMPIAQRCMALLVDGISMNVPEVEPNSYREFRLHMGELAPQLPAQGSDEQKLILARTIIREFETYSNASSSSLRDTQGAWQALLDSLLGQLLNLMGVPGGSSDANELRQRIRSLKGGDEVRQWRGDLEKFLDPLGPNAQQGAKNALRQANQSTENDNAAGLPGGGKALERIGKIMESGGNAFIVIFQLRCLEIISQRFGTEAVEDCLMAVSAFLNEGLEGHDTIYHWSDATLLAVLQNRPNEALLTAEVQRILSQNRESSIQVAGRPIMVRIPLTFDIIPISRLRAPEDLLRITGRNSAK